MRQFLLTAVFAIMPTLALALAPFQLEMRITQYGFIDLTAQGTLALAPVEQHWQMSLAADARIGRQTEVSEFSWRDGQIEPLSYQSLTRLTLFSERKQYQWQDGRITGRVNNNSVDTRGEGVLGPMTSILNMSQQLANGAHSWQQQSISWRSAKQEAFAISRQGYMNTAVGRLRVTLVEQTEGNGHGEQHYYWFADDYGYIPIRWRKEVDGKIKYEVRLLSGTYNDQPITGE